MGGSRNYLLTPSQSYDRLRMQTRNTPMVARLYPVTEILNALKGMKLDGSKGKLGVYKAIRGWTVNGESIDIVRVDRYNVVYFMDAKGRILAKFQDNIGLDD